MQVRMFLNSLYRKWHPLCCSLMKFTFLFSFFSLNAVAPLLADDAPKPPTKKEYISAIPHVWISEGLLFMKAREDKLSYANRSEDLSATNFTNNSLRQPHFDSNTGINLNLGYQPKNQYYFLSLFYIQNSAYGNHVTSGTKGFFPVSSMDDSLTASSFVTSANTNWKLNTFLMDAGTMFPFKINKFFAVKVHTDLRIASLLQKSKT